MMEAVRLGRSDVVVSRLALGTAGFGSWVEAGQAERLLVHAIEGGVSLIDTAHAYGDSQAIIGAALDRETRAACTIATKFSTDGLGDDDDVASIVERQIADNLRSLRTWRLDLLQLHEEARPGHLDAIVRLLERCVDDGSVALIGLCNYGARALGNFLRLAPAKVTERLVSVQNHFSLLSPGALTEDIPATVSHRLSFMAWSPLGGGLLAHNRRDTTRNWMPWDGRDLHRAYDARDALPGSGIAAALDFVWRAAPGSIAIAGPSNVEQLDTLLRVAQRRASTAI
jgi:aryl-alcohol dehydrogenase-like predicted oxidoreductase